MEQVFKLPELGEGIEAGEIVRVLVAPGDQVEAGQPVLELETDKALLEVECPFAGKVLQVFVKDGDNAPVGSALLSVETAAEAPPEAAPAAPLPAAAVVEAPSSAAPVEKPAMPPPEPAPPPQPPTAVGISEVPLPAGPASRRLARELGVDLSQVAGSGRGGRITEEDVRQFVRDRMASLASLPPLPAEEAAAAEKGPPDSDQGGPVERLPFRSVRRRTAERLSQSWNQIPHVTHFDLADVTDLEALRRRHAERATTLGVKLTVTALMLRATVVALKDFPTLNATLEEDEIVLKKYYHLGVAVDTPRGLLVPVIRDADRKTLFELARELTDLSERARAGRLELAELQGSTFTITNLGGIGGTHFTPLINPPEVAILGVARSREEPVVRHGEIQVRLMLPLCLSYDHRVIDGATAARFVRKLVELMEDPERLLLGG